MRVLHLQKVAGIGGSERHLLDLLQGLRDQDISCAMCILAAEDWRVFSQALDRRGVEWTVLRAGPDLNPALVPRLWQVVKKWQPDLIHTHLIHGAVYGQIVAQLARRPTVTSVHSTSDFYRTGPYSPLARSIGRLARKTIAISQHVGTYLTEAGVVRPDRLRVIPYGVDPSPWRVPRKIARSHYQLPEDVFALGVASRLVEKKGHDRLLRAFARVSPKVDAPKLLIAGSGPLRSQLEGLAKDLGIVEQVSFLGFVEDVPTFMAACDVVAFPSLGFPEGFGLAALEAGAAGRPVIAFATGTMPEVIRHRETGILVPPGDTDEFARAIDFLASNRVERERMGRMARQRAERDFSIDRMVADTVKVYAEVLDG